MTLQHHLTQLYPNVWRLIAPNPSPMTGPGTNTYFAGGDRLAIIDPGPDNAGHIAQIQAAVQTLDAEVEAVIITHIHADHAGCAEQVAKVFDAPLLRFKQPFAHSDKFTVDSVTLEIHHTPGHIQAHVCPLLVEQRLLFAGDLVAGGGTVVVIPPDGDMADYLNSLRAMQALAPAAILPGHGPVIDNPQQLLQQYIDHRLVREQQVLHWLAQGYTTAQAIAAQIYADRPEVLGIATLQTEAHLAKLRKEGRL